MNHRASWLLLGVTAWAIAATVAALRPSSGPPGIGSAGVPCPVVAPLEATARPQPLVERPVLAEQCPPCGALATSPAAATLPSPPGARELDLINRCEREHEFEWCDTLSDLYREGREGVAIDLVRAAKYAQLACDGGERGACRDVADALWSGHGVPQDQRRALRLFEQLCEDDSTRCFWLGSALREAGPLRDLPRALATFQRACAERHALSCLAAGELLLERKQDQQAGAAFLETSCDLGLSMACEALADLHRRSGALPDEARLRSDLERACKLGAMAACDELHAK